MPIDDVIEETTAWTRAPDPMLSVGTGQPQRRAMTDGGHSRQTLSDWDHHPRGSMQAQAVQIPNNLEFWVQVAQLAILVLIMLRQ